MITIEFVEKLIDPLYKQKLLSLLLACDDDFFPTISAKRNPHDGKKETGLRIYMDEKKDYHYLLVWDEGRLIAFSNFVLDFTIPCFPDYPKSLHIDTVCVERAYRNQGIGKRIYQYYEEMLPDAFRATYYTLETSSINKPQIKLMEKFQYEIICRITDDRGKGIDTIYFGKKITR